MYNNWNVDLSDSVEALEKIKHDVLPKLVSGKIHSIEKSQKDIMIKFGKEIDTQNPILKLLDIKSGIDYIREDSNGLQGIASRVQWGEKAWNSFTIRHERHTGAETEYQKRLKQIRNGYFYPAFTLQAYFDNRTDNNLLSVAVIRTTDLYKFAEQYQNYVRQNKSDNVFKIVFWSDLIQKGYSLKCIPKYNISDKKTA